MDATHQNRDEQTKIWNGLGGCAWIEKQDVLDRMFKPFEDLLVEAVDAVSRGSVLDVGCGTGATTLAVARHFGARGRAVGVDISDPMIAVARARAAREQIPAEFICANAQEHVFEPPHFDTIISRFGVMFFDDPVRAFSNLRRAVSDNAALRLIVWRDAADNPFMTTAERAAAPMLNLPERQPDAPGQFALANAGRVETIFRASGWTDVALRPLDVECTMPEQELIPYLTRLGPVGRQIQEMDQETRTKIVGVIRPAFDPFVHGGDVRFTAACWMVNARASAGGQP